MKCSHAIRLRAECDPHSTSEERAAGGEPCNADATHEVVGEAMETDPFGLCPRHAAGWIKTATQNREIRRLT